MIPRLAKGLEGHLDDLLGPKVPLRFWLHARMLHMCANSCSITLCKYIFNL